MERLTNGVDYCQLQCDFGKDRCFFQDQSKCYENNMYNKLREYEIAEEQGLLLRLKLKVGDEFWELNDNFVEPVIYPRKAHSLQHVLYCMDNLGKTTFLTYEEAELELANRQQSHAEAILDERNGR